MPNIKQTAKQAAINAAKQLAREGNEYLKSAKLQVAQNSEGGAQSPQPDSGKSQEVKKMEERSDLAKVREHAGFMATYRNELEQIRKDNLFKELQAKIASGETIPFENYTKELSWEQMQVLKAQEEAVKARKATQSTNLKSQGIPQIVSKKARGMIQGIVKKRNQQVVETRQPPSS